MTSVAKNATLLTIKKVSSIQKFVAVKTFETILVEPAAFGSDSELEKNMITYISISTKIIKQYKKNPC